MKFNKKNQIKIIFFGEINFSEKILNFLIKKKFNIVGVVTRKKSTNHDFKDLSTICKKNGIPCKYKTNINNKEIKEWLKKIKVDLIICLGWNEIISKDIFNLPKISSIGYHPAKLPQNRGKHPVIWSLILGLKNTYSTFFHLTDKVDSGNIISQEKVLIKDHYYAKHLYNSLIKKAKSQISRILFNKRYFNRQKKIKITQTNYWRKRNYKDGKIDWRMSAENIRNLVRGLSDPYPNAFFTYRKKEYFVKKINIKKSKDKNIEPGKIIKNHREKKIIKCGINAVELLVVEPKLKILRKDNYLE